MRRIVVQMLRLCFLRIRRRESTQDHHQYTSIQKLSKFHPGFPSFSIAAAARSLMMIGERIDHTVYIRSRRVREEVEVDGG
jgi:hypothetical protein